MSNIPSEFILMFLGMVFIAVFLLSQGVVVPVFGEAGRMRKRIRGRLHVLEKANHLPNMQTVLRQKYLTRLSPLEARLEQLPFMANLTQLIEQSGHEYRAYRVMLLGLVLGAAAGALVLMVSPVWWMALLAAFAVTWVPVLKILRTATSVSPRSRKVCRMRWTPCAEPCAPGTRSTKPCVWSPRSTRGRSPRNSA